MRATAWRKMPNRTSQRVEWLDSGLENVHYPYPMNNPMNNPMNILTYWVIGT